jgi:LmbE family N-acetylglucosaminyl deacetylase
MILIVVAHPDDECLWCGGFLLRLRDAGERVTIVCVTNANNPVRGPEFFAACKMLGADGVMLDHADGTHFRLPDLAGDLDAAVGKNVDSVACVLTHAPHGNERGHAQHVDCFRVVRAWAAKRKIPFGVFSEAPLPHLRTTHDISRSQNVESAQVQPTGESRWYPLPQAVRWLARGRPGAAVWHLRRWKEPMFLDAQVLLKVAVRADRKRALCQCHPSQFSGLADYAALDAPFEYIYVNDRKSGRAIAEAIQ